MKALVAGSVRIDEKVRAFEGAILRIIVEDVTHTDASSSEVGRMEIPRLAYTPGDSPVQFAVTLEDMHPGRRYEIRAHLDRNGNGTYSAGDQITKESHPVLTQGFPATVELRLSPI